LFYICHVMEFEVYLKEKKIDPMAFKASEPEQWAEFERVFMQMHPKSFTMQKLNLINNIRRKYHLAEEENGASKVSSKKMVKPKIRPAGTGSAKSSKPKMAKPNVKPKPKMSKPKIDTKSKSEEKQAEEKPQTPKVKPIIKRPKKD